MNKEEQIKDIIEILELSKEEIESNNENITATLDLQDLKSLKNLYDLYQAEKEKNKILEEKQNSIRELLEDVNETLEYAKNNDLVDTIFFINCVKNLLEKLLEE